MAKAIGRLVQFGIAKESSRGTPNASADFYIPWDSLSWDEKNNNVDYEQVRGIIEDTYQGNLITKQWAEGQIKAPIGDKFFPLVLFNVLGSLSTGANADGSGTIKDHTITVGQSAQHQALSVFIDDPVAAQDYKHAVGMISSLEINYEQGKFVSFTAALKAKKGATATLTPAATASESRFLPQHLTFKLAATQSGLNAASATVLKSASLKFTPNIEDDDVLGSITPADFLNKQFAIEGTLEALWQNESDFKTAEVAATVQAMRFDLKNTDVTIGTSANPELKIDLHSVVFKELARSIEPNGLVKQTLQFKAYYNTTDSKMITIVATNAQASY